MTIRPAGALHSPPMRAARRAALRLPILRRLARGQRGQAMAEFAMLIPMLLVVIFAITEFGFMLTDQLTITNAARDAARAGALEGSTTAAAVTQAQSDATNLIACTLKTPTAAFSGSPTVITVVVSCNYAPVTPLAAVVHLMGGSVNTTITLSSTAIMRQEQ